MCGRGRKDLQHVEAVTKTNIYLPTPFPGVYGYKPPKTLKRFPDTIFITGEPEKIQEAIGMIKDLVIKMKLYVKEISMSLNKIDCLILEKLDNIKKIMSDHGAF